MNNTKKIIRQNLGAYIFSLIAVILAFQGFYRSGFGSDTITHFYNPFINIDSELQYGRYIPYLMDILLYRAGIIATDHYRVFFLFFILVVAVAGFILQLCFMPFYRDKRGNDEGIVSETVFRLCVMLPFISSLFSEFMMFPECFVYCVGFLFVALAVYFLSKKKYLAAVIFVILGSCTYQITAVLTAIYGVLYMALDEDMKFSKELLIQEILVMFCSMGMGLANFGSTKLVFLLSGSDRDNPKTMSDNSFTDSLKNAVEIFGSFLKDGRGLMPAPYIILLSVAVAIVFGIICFRGKELRMVTWLLLILAVFSLAMLLPAFHSAPSRITFTLYAAVAALLIVGQLYFNAVQGSIIKTLSAVIIILQIFVCQQIAVNHYISNEQDLLYAGQVLDAIERYETETGITVEYIATCNDDRCLTHYDNVYYTSGQINERSLGIVSYSLLEYADRVKNGNEEHRFERVNMDKGIYKAHFKGKDFEEFNLEEQLIIDGNAAFWCAF